MLNSKLKFIKDLIPLLGCMLAMQSRCKCITAWLQTKEMAFIVHTTVGSCSKAILIVDGVPTGLLFQDYFCFNMLKSNNLQYNTLGRWVNGTITIEQ